MSTDLHETLRGLASRPLTDAELRALTALLVAEPPAVVADAAAAADVFTPMLVNGEEERLGVAAIDRQARIIDKAILTVGAFGYTVVDNAKVLRWVLTRERPASGFIIAHNHPSGDHRPSAEDDAVTKRLAEAANLIGVRLIDHVIVTFGGSYSYARQGRMPERFAGEYPPPFTG